MDDGWVGLSGSSGQTQTTKRYDRQVTRGFRHIHICPGRHNNGRQIKEKKSKKKGNNYPVDHVETNLNG